VADTREKWIAGGVRTHLAGTEYRIFVRVDGPESGSPVTLLHGFPSSSHDWATVLPFLTEAGFRVTTVDFLGFGESDKPARHQYSLREQADIVEAAWDAEGVTSTALVAHDYGVSVAQELLARDPGRITSMSWLNGGLFPDLHRPTRGQRLLHGRLGPLFARVFNEKRFGPSIREVFGRPVSDEMVHEMWLSLDARGGTRVAPRLLRYIDERREHAAVWASALATYAGPQQFIWGPADPVSGAHVLPRIRELAPNAQVTVLDDGQPVGHYPQLEAPELVGPLLVDFLTSAGHS
jgi:pimeloyl-ACP methyl ester carboxylesterase